MKKHYRVKYVQLYSDAVEATSYRRRRVEDSAPGSKEQNFCDNINAIKTGENAFRFQASRQEHSPGFGITTSNISKHSFPHPGALHGETGFTFKLLDPEAAGEFGTGTLHMKTCPSRKMHAPGMINPSCSSIPAGVTVRT